MKTSIFRLLLALTLLLTVGQLSTRAAPLVTNVCGTINTNTTWSLINSPYDVCIGGVTIGPAATLTIEPGVTVQFENLGNNQLTVNGALNAIGTPCPADYVHRRRRHTGIVGRTVGEQHRDRAGACQPELCDTGVWRRQRLVRGAALCRSSRSDRSRIASSATAIATACTLRTITRRQTSTTRVLSATRATPFNSINPRATS